MMLRTEVLELVPTDAARPAAIEKDSPWIRRPFLTNVFIRIPPFLIPEVWSDQAPLTKEASRPRDSSRMSKRRAKCQDPKALDKSYESS